MGQGQEQKIRPDPRVQIQERGEIYFFYRPKIGKEEAHSADDVQRLYIILRPESGERAVEEKQEPDSGKEGSHSRAPPEPDTHGHSHTSASESRHGSQKVNIEEQALFRLIVMGRKRLPDPRQKSLPYWGFVEMVTTNSDHVTAALKAEEYVTSSRGQRHTSAARAVGEGVYRILNHNPNPVPGGKTTRTHAHLIYKLEFPPQGVKDEPQESLNIQRQGSFIIQIKNPDNRQTHFRGLQNKRKAVFPAHLQGQLGHLKFAPVDPPDFLNYEGCEFLLVSASDDIGDELGLELLTEGEADASCSDLVNTFGDTAPTTPLFKGTSV